MVPPLETGEQQRAGLSMPGEALVAAGPTGALTPGQVQAWEAMSIAELQARAVTMEPSSKRREMMEFEDMAVAGVMTAEELVAGGYTLTPESFQAGKAFSNKLFVAGASRGQQRAAELGGEGLRRVPHGREEGECGRGAGEV